MKVLLLSCGLVAALPAMAQRPAPARKAVASRPPTDVYSSLLNLGKEVARLLRQAMAEPNDTKAMAMLNGQETARLMKKAEQLNPSFRSWVDTMTEKQREEVMQRFLKESPLMQCVDSLEHNPETKTRLERSPGLQNAIQSLVYYTF